MTVLLLSTFISLVDNKSIQGEETVLKSDFSALYGNLTVKETSQQLNMATGKIPDIPERFSWEKELKRVAWFKEDLQKGVWNTVKSLPGATHYIKCFPEDPFPIKVLNEWELPIPASVASKVYWNFEDRRSWDEIFSHHELVDTSEDGGKIAVIPLKMSWPFSDREWVAKLRIKEFIDQRAWLVTMRNATHPSKPERNDVVRCDERNPREACRVLTLSTSNYDGVLPKLSTWFLGQKVSAAFEKCREALLKANAEKQFDKYRY